MRYPSSAGLPREGHARFGKGAPLLIEKMVGSEGSVIKEPVLFCPYPPSGVAEAGTVGERGAG